MGKNNDVEKNTEVEETFTKVTQADNYQDLSGLVAEAHKKHVEANKQPPVTAIGIFKNNSNKQPVPVNSTAGWSTQMATLAGLYAAQIQQETNSTAAPPAV